MKIKYFTSDDFNIGRMMFGFEEAARIANEILSTRGELIIDFNLENEEVMKVMIGPVEYGPDDAPVKEDKAQVEFDMTKVPIDG